MSLIIYAGMPLTLLFAVHLTLILLARSTARPAPVGEPVLSTEPDEIADPVTSPQLNGHDPRLDGHESMTPAAMASPAPPGGPRTPLRFNGFEAANGRTLLNSNNR